VNDYRKALHGVLRCGIAMTAACRAAPDESEQAARDLTSALQSSRQMVDSAAARKVAEFEKCIYVYSREEGVRECLVVQHNWTPAEAAREIATYRARITRVTDSLYAEERRLAAQIESERAKKLEAARRREQGRLAALVAGVERRSREYASRADSFPVWGSRPNKAYFASRETCYLARVVPSHDRLLFLSEEEAKAIGFIAYDSDFQCKVFRDPSEAVRSDNPSDKRPGASRR
jgi:hypothetical protein